ncbi:MAG: hypothetical protein GX874_10855, partial [Smithella sp.]|nr:hypothetical protein [Smithella sp.]
MKEANSQEGMDKPGGAGPTEICLEDLSPDLKAACARAGWTSLAPVQAMAIPFLLAAR